MNIDYKKFKSEVLYIDGSYRDIIIDNTTIEVWRKFIEFVGNTYISSIVIDDEELSLFDKSIDDIFILSETTNICLKILILNFEIHCFFWDESYIELDFDPTDINDERHINEIITFISLLSFVLKKEVHIMGENAYINDFRNYLYTVVPSFESREELYLNRIHKTMRLKLKKKKNYGVLFDECIQKIEGRILLEFTNRNIKGKLDDLLLEKFNETTYDNALREMRNNEIQEVLIIWDNAELPVVRAEIKNILQNIDDVLAVSFDTWICSEDFKCVFEFNHEGSYLIRKTMLES
ncbi:CDI toxin immunity protein [Oceanirhabdus sp. W0125-5]|uniref:CDI toxin immunity protein n=1 Tax=Oceanirhabdus sp. W0125-5 TaxID=2999116 RepID=UPI0022F342CD|nr:hypothetical protein [Oceanirhabdus sp. W0125-5]WBW98363.1 hypothetical protein OW730_06235 [Oceanirhabdus sp. W0125-5]